MRRAAVLPCALLFAAVLGFSQQLPKPEELCSVEGSVVNSQTGEPVKHAQVVLQSSGSPQGSTFGASTDAAGKFKLVQLDPGSYRTSVRKEGFSEEARRRGQVPPVLTLATGQNIVGLVFKLAPGAVITGRVTDETGDAMMGVAIQALRPTYMDGRRQMSNVGSAATDDRGNYRMAALPAGRYVLKASYGERLTGMVDRSPDSSTPSYADVYYPGVNEESQASAVLVRAGEERQGVDFRMFPVRTFRIRGRVVPPSGLTARMLSIVLTGRGPMSSRGGSSTIQLPSEDGSFEISGVTPGAYDVCAVPFAGTSQLRGRTPVDVANANVNGVEVVLSAGIEIKGHLRVEDPPRNPKYSLSDFRVFLQSKELSYFAVGPMGTGDVHADGSFAFQNVGAGDYVVHIFPVPENFYLKAVRLGDADVLADGLTVNESSAGGELEVVMSPNGGKLKGTVKDADSKPVAGATVVLIPEETRARDRRYASADADQLGRYTVSGIAPGAYTVYAWTAVEAGAWQDPSFLVQYKDQGQRVVIEEKAQQSVDLTAVESSDSEN